MTRGGEALLTTMTRSAHASSRNPGGAMTSSRSNPSRWTMTCTSKARLVWTCTSHPALRTPPSRPSSCAWTRTAPRATTELPSPRSGWIRRTPRRTSRRNPPREHRHVGHLLDGARRVAHPLRYLIFHFPAQYSVHTNHAGLWSEQTGTQVAHQTIHMGRRHAVRHRAAGAWLRYGFDND